MLLDGMGNENLTDLTSCCVKEVGVFQSRSYECGFELDPAGRITSNESSVIMFQQPDDPPHIGCNVTTVFKPRPSSLHQTSIPASPTSR